MAKKKNKQLAGQPALGFGNKVDGKQGLLLEVAARPERWPQIQEAWDKFMTYLVTDTPPPLMEKDVLIRDDAGWKAAAEAYVEAKAAVDGAAVLLDAAKEKLVALASHTSEQGHGVTVTRYVKSGAVDYKKVPELKGVDLERYRGTVRQEVRITLSKI